MSQIDKPKASADSAPKTFKPLYQPVLSLPMAEAFRKVSKDEQLKIALILLTNLPTINMTMQ